MTRVERGFDRLAPVYDRLVRLFAGEAIPASQSEWISSLAPAGRILVVGGGTGEFLGKLCAAMPRARIVNVDLSSRMLQQARRRTGPNVEHRHGGLETVREEERFDLICTHCFLDLFEGRELEEVMAALDRSLEPEGAWMFSDFQTGSTVRSLHVRSLYLFFRLTCGLRMQTLPDFQSDFTRLGYRCIQSREFLEGMLISSIYRRQL